MSARAIIDVETRHTIQNIGRAGDHNLRQYQPANTDPVRTPLNQILVGSPDDDLAMIASEKIGDQKLRKDARRAAEILLSASPVFFRPDSPESTGTWNRDRLEEWKRSTMGWLNQKYGKNVISAVLHLDESTPHIHAVVLPIRKDGSLSYKAFWGEKSDLRNLHTEYAESLNHLGIQRGMENSQAKPDDIKDYYRRVNTAKALIPEIEEEEEIETSFEIPFVGSWVRAETAENIKNREREKAEKIRDEALSAIAQEQESKRLAVERAVVKAVQKYLPMGEENETLKSYLSAQAERIAAIEKQAHEVKIELEKQRVLREEAEGKTVEAEERIKKLETERVAVAQAVLENDPRLRVWSDRVLEQQNCEDEEEDDDFGPE